MQSELIDKIKGVIYGQAIGDALGLGAEFLTKNQVQQFYPFGLSNYDQIIQDGHRSRWEKGEWTDDTDQMLCIFNSILDKKSLDIRDIAKNLHEWATNGGRGIGNTIFAVLSSDNFLKEPHAASNAIWVKSGKTLAANGGAMRTSILGVWEYHDIQKVKENASNVCKITHSDPRCVATCVAIDEAIAYLLQGETNVDVIYEKTMADAVVIEEKSKEYFALAKFGSIEQLELNQKDAIGYTYKALAVAFWALRQTSFEEGVVKVINEGGDADTNGAVAGAVLGAKLGFSQIPKRWVEGLKNREALDDKIQRLINIMQKHEAAHTPASSENSEQSSPKTSFWENLKKIFN
jgi:ADP-ribosylglycohydrolase